MSAIILGLVATACVDIPVSSVDDGSVASDADASAVSDAMIDASPDLLSLVDLGLLVRYFIDEASAGQTRKKVLDHGPGVALDLDIFYDGELDYFAILGNRGLAWRRAGRKDIASAAIDGSKIRDLDNSTTGTIEIVAHIVAVMPEYAHLLHIGDSSDDSGHFTLRTNDINEVQLWLNNAELAAWDVTLGIRTVLTVVVDTTQVTDTDRVKLYVDGTLVNQDRSSPPTVNTPIMIPGNRSLSLGNSPNEDGRSIEGRIYYAALYENALTQEQAKQNASLLIVNDDQ